MSPDTSVQQSNRNAALAALRFKKNAQKLASSNASSTGSLIASSTSSSVYQIPAQSRDATAARAPYINNNLSKPLLGNVLFPDSSPVRSNAIGSSSTETSYKPHQSQFFSNGDLAQTIELPSLPRLRREPDLLTAPTGFTRSQSSSSISLSSNNLSAKFTGNPRLLEEEDDDRGPPRKKLNRGESSTNPISLESSPDLKPSSQRVPSTPLSTNNHSSDSELPDPMDILKNQTSPEHRIIRGTRPEEKAIPVELTKLILTHPTHSPARVTTAFKLCDGDVKAAIMLMEDSSWTHEIPETPTRSPSTSMTQPLVGGTNKRAAEKEKGKKSMIYAKRNALTVTQEAVTPVKPEPIHSVVSPVISQPFKRKAVKHIVASSDSEAEHSNNGSDDSDSETADQIYFDQALKWLNECEPTPLVELAGITLQQAKTLISLRPFEDVDDFNTKLSRKNKTGLSKNILGYCKELFESYRTVDNLLEKCEKIGAELREAIDKWKIGKVPEASSSKLAVDEEDGSLALLESLPEDYESNGDFILKQPSLLSDTVQLKEYQLLGVNWMYLLYQRELSCILADEMGLGKTVQVIAFLALLKECESPGRHLIVVPSSTLENWLREFNRFAPSINVQAYYGSQKEREELRFELKNNAWDVLVTTYNLAQGDERDRKFFRKFDWTRYGQLMKIQSKWRLLLTGTPLQNNLQELVSLMNFILPRYFNEVNSTLRTIFKVKADRQISLLARDRVSRAKKMMAPFVLRRRKDMVLKDLPKKSERIEWCEMTPLQKSIYRDTLQRSRKAVLELTVAEPEDNPEPTKGKKRPRETKKTKDTSNNVLMDLRKAACHPMLFRRLFDDSVVKAMAKQCMREPEFCESNYKYIVEDMEVMTDAELQVFSLKYKSTRKFSKDPKCFEDAGKITRLLTLLKEYEEQGRRILIFSQVLDILQAILKNRKTKFLVLTGSTAVDVRQALVDEFNEDESIPVFLLSTKAGGMGINLTAASVVVLFDQDFNPHNDRQAADRAYRIGQKQDVEVIKFITKSTIEEDMFRLGQTKLALDEAVAGDDTGDGQSDEKAEKKMRTSLLSVLREQFEREELQEGTSRGESSVAEVEEDTPMI
ncbi:hypothetical protein Clacol_000413 [Clathrus columnatus]|uniref:Uncharacterized protein n=1 Tax=Clathrus columnatus TaxID=1419009 RepID=A0AAV5A0T0_9AGAM|nr:hypothetical protein Clacol_000413 [Clathrus columnatus]